MIQTSRHMRNTQLAKLLRSVAAALSLRNENNRFRVIAYEKAADAIEHATSEVKDLYDDGKLSSLPGIGTSITSHLEELFKTGRVKHFEQELKGFPDAMFELMEIPGIGPKLAYKFCQKLGLTHTHSAIDKLEKAARKGRLRDIDGMGIDSEQNILEGINQWKKRSTRVLLPTANESAQAVLSWLRKNPHVKRAEPLGSLRRMNSTVGDIDIAIVTDTPKSVIDHFTKFPGKDRLIEAGPTSASITLTNGIRVDLMVQPLESFGSLLQHFTGSKHHNISLREMAMKKHLSLSEKGIKSKGKLKTFETEESFYQYLGLDWIPPELREDNGEIVAASSHSLPQLVDVRDLKGDLHIHSNFPIEPSHDLGIHTMEEYIAKALALGYEYLGFTEHNPSVSSHTTHEIMELLKAKKEKVEKINYSNKNRGINILNGLEIDIRPDGQLSLPEEGFVFLDYAIASIHGSFKGSRADQTRRVLRALSHPKIKIFGHPTARKLNEREGVDLDWETIFALCLKRNIVLEINSCPDRLDLPDILVRDAVKRGVKLVIDTDSHQIDSMAQAYYGVSVARRGWAQKQDILNTQPWDKFYQSFVPLVET